MVEAGSGIAASRPRHPASQVRGRTPGGRERCDDRVTAKEAPMFVRLAVVFAVAAAVLGPAVLA